jgi:rhs family protein
LENININTALTRRGIMETLMERDGMSRKQAKKKATDLAMKLREDAINFAKKQGYIREKTSYG